MTLVMVKVPLEQGHYDTCYRICATGTVIMTTVTDMPLEESL